MILGAQCALPVSHAIDGAPVLSGHIYVAPPNAHLVLEGQVMRLRYGPRINFVRPSIASLFRSAAREYGDRAIGIILSGNLDDGVAGLMAIQRSGGKVIVQRPEEAAVPEMHTNALRNLKADFVVNVSEMSEVLMILLSSHASGAPLRRSVPPSLTLQKIPPRFQTRSTIEFPSPSP
jgi:two-component system chemotaxis response regulator CheB